MERKPVIVIMTSRGEFGGASEALAQAVRREGTHNVVILDESKYDSRARFSRLDKLMQISDEYRMVADKRMTAKEAFRYDREGERSGGRMGRRSRRIANAVKRYRPEFLLAVTPYACAVAAEAKRKAGFGTSVIYMMNGFVVHGEGAVHDADCYIVENGDMKAELVQRGVPSRKVMVLGLPFDAPDLTPIEKEAKKQELGLPRTPTVFLNERGKRERAELLRLLTDQGNILNTVCYTGDPASVASLRTISDEEGGVGGTVILTKEELFDEYLSVSDIAVTSYDPSVIYKCMKSGKAVIVCEPEGGRHSADAEYLEGEGLVLLARRPIDTVALIYKLMQTATAARFAEAGEKRTEMFSAANTASYLTGWIAPNA